MFGGQPRDDEQAQPRLLGQRHEAEVRRVPQRLVQPVELLLLQPDALVLDLHDGTAPDQLAAHLDAGLRRGERGRVVDELGEQVHQVADDRPGDRRGGQLAHRDALVVLGLGDRTPHQVGDRDRVAELPAGLLPAHDDQVLGVAPGTGGEVVQPEQHVQLVRVLLLALRRVERLQLAVHDHLTAVRDVEEHALRTLAGLGLVHGGGDGGLLRLVERVGDLADLVLAVLQVGHLAGQVHLVTATDTLHQTRHLVLGDVQRLGTQRRQPVDQPVRQTPGEEERGGGDHQHGRGGGDRGRQRLVGLVDGEVRRVGALLHVEAPQRRADLARGLTPLVLRHRQVVLVAPEEGVLHREQRVPRLARNQLVVLPADLRDHLRDRLLQRGVVGTDLTDVAAELLLGESAAGEAGRGERVTAGHRVRGGEQRHRHQTHVRGLGTRCLPRDTVQTVDVLVDDAVVVLVGLLQGDRTVVDPLPEPWQPLDLPERRLDAFHHALRRAAGDVVQRLRLPLCGGVGGGPGLLQLRAQRARTGDLLQGQPALRTDGGEEPPRGLGRVVHARRERPDLDRVVDQIARDRRSGEQEDDAGHEGDGQDPVPDRRTPTA